MTARQGGFTLIELMVVLVIIAVVLAAGVLSFRSDENRYLHQQVNQIQGLFQAGCDEAVFRHHLVFFAVSEKGLQAYALAQGEWQTITRLKTLTWHETIQVEWSAPSDSLNALKAPGEGWMCWPTGSMTAGEIQLNHRSLTWDEGGEFVLGEAQK